MHLYTWYLGHGLDVERDDQFKRAEFLLSACKVIVGLLLLAIILRTSSFPTHHLLLLSSFWNLIRRSILILVPFAIAHSRKHDNTITSSISSILGDVPY